MGKDPAFLFYDGDASRDVSHMNRLERGAYFDFIQAQKKFGAMKIDLIKKVLGNDFESTWDTLKLIMTYVDDTYSIFWLSESIKEREEYCKSRKDNRNHGKINKIRKRHMSNTCKSYVEHMEDEDEDINKDINTIEKRLISFKESINLYPQYPEEMRIEFIKYWSEKNKSGTKMRFELEKTWELEKRLARWANNNKQFKQKSFGRQELTSEDIKKSLSWKPPEMRYPKDES